MKTLPHCLLFTLILLFSSSALAINQQQAANIAQQSNPGRVLAIKKNAGTFQVKILSSNGDVRIILVDAKSGKVLN